MPVNDDVHSELDTYIHALFQELSASFLVLHVALTVAPFVNVHRHADYICVPVVAQGSECVFVYEVRKPGDSVRAHAPELVSLSVFVHKLGSPYGKLTVSGYRSSSVRILGSRRNRL